MNGVITEPRVVADGVSMLLPPHLLVSFEKADRQLTEAYGESPGVEALVRMWLACATSSIVRCEFEYSALNIETRIIPFNEGGESDGDDN